VLHKAWFWEGPWPAGFSWGWAYELDPAMLTLLLVVGAMAWPCAALQPLWLRGCWITVTTLVCLTLNWTAWEQPYIHAFTGAHPWLVVAILGLLFPWVPNHERLAKRLAVLSGVILLAYLLWPVRDWNVPAWRVLWGTDPMDGAYAPFLRFLVAYSLVMGGLLIWLGLKQGKAVLVRRLIVTALPVLIGLDLLVSVLMVQAGAEPLPGDEGHIVWNALRLALRPYALVALVTTGLFCWIVGVRGEGDETAVFE
jgi:hypothetical protein